MQLTSISGRVVFPHGIVHAQISIDPVSGAIVSISELPGKQDGPLIFPGLIDLHVHAREYPRPEESDTQALEKWTATCKKETFLTVRWPSRNKRRSVALCGHAQRPRSA